MKSFVLLWKPSTGWSSLPDEFGAVSLVLCFADRLFFAAEAPVLGGLRDRFPKALFGACSTAGEISGATVSDASATALVISFRSTQVKGVCLPLEDGLGSEGIGKQLAMELTAPALRHVLVLSDGLFVNGTQLAAGISAALPEGVCATGGLAGDGSRFQETAVGLGTDFGAKRVVGIGFYGPDFRVGFGSQGGWQAFGPKRLITRSTGNVLYELDGQPALPLYKRYLGERASGLPATGLLFPLQLIPQSAEDQGLVRTILAVDEQAQSLTFAGDVPEGSYARLMKAGCDALVDGAAQAAHSAVQAGVFGQSAAILVSCVGRKLVMGQRVEDETDAVLHCLGANISVAGFYSYGELCPTGSGKDCELHNQTMTLTLFSEVP